MCIRGKQLRLDSRVYSSGLALLPWQKSYSRVNLAVTFINWMALNRLFNQPTANHSDGSPLNRTIKTPPSFRALGRIKRGPSAESVSLHQRGCHRHCHIGSFFNPGSGLATPFSNYMCVCVYTRAFECTQVCGCMYMRMRDLQVSMSRSCFLTPLQL